MIENYSQMCCKVKNRQETIGNTEAYQRSRSDEEKNDENRKKNLKYVKNTSRSQKHQKLPKTSKISKNVSGKSH